MENTASCEKVKLNSSWKRGSPGERETEREEGRKWMEKRNRKSDTAGRNDPFCSQQTTRDDEVHFIPVMDRVFNFFSPGLMYIDSKFLFFSFYFPFPDIDDVTQGTVK